MNHFLIITTGCILGITYYRSTVRDGGDFPTPEVMVAALLGLLAFIAAVAVEIISIRRIQLGKSRGVAIACMLLCTPVFWPLVKFEIAAAKREKWSEWRALGDRLKPVLAEYHGLHPDRFRYVEEGSEEVVVDGFVEFAKKKLPELDTKKVPEGLALRDPWGDAVCFVMSRGDDEKINFRGPSEHIQFGWGGEEAPENPCGLGIARSGGIEPLSRRDYERPVVIVSMQRGRMKSHLQDLARSWKKMPENLLGWLESQKDLHLFEYLTAREAIDDRFYAPGMDPQKADEATRLITELAFRRYEKLRKARDVDGVAEFFDAEADSLLKYRMIRDLTDGADQEFSARVVHRALGGKNWNFPKGRTAPEGLTIRRELFNKLMGGPEAMERIGSDLTPEDRLAMMRALEEKWPVLREPWRTGRR